MATTPKSKSTPKTPTQKKTASKKNEVGIFSDHEGRVRGHRYAKIIARAWADQDFKKRLLEDPVGVFAEYELTVPPGKTLVVLTEAPAKTPRGKLVFVLPEPPTDWIELEAGPLAISPKDDWLDGAGSATAEGKPKPPKTMKPPCAKCWNGCC